MPPSPSAPKIEYRHNVASGRHEIGVKDGKTFVPFATVDDAYYAQLKENADSQTDNGDENEEDA